MQFNQIKPKYYKLNFKKAEKSVKKEIKNIIIMKRFYSPDSYCASGACVNDLLSQRIKSSQHIQSTISLSTYQPQQTKKIGRYYYNESDQIGRGYTSKVYKAYAVNGANGVTTDSETYAIKVIGLGKATPSSMQLLESEIQILKMVDHPNVIKCYDIYKSKTHCYIVTQYCPGGCLMSFVSKHHGNVGKKHLSQKKVVSIVQQIVDGVKYLQLKGILHRDIKPANILKGKNSWKIADFGFAIKSFAEVKSKFNVGTPLYMPFESLTQNLYSPQSDIFSVGIILYEMITGTTPWESKSEKELIRKLQLIPLERTSGKNIISPQVFKLIAKLCTFRKKNRMTKQEFSQLSIAESIKHQAVHNPEVSIIDLKEELLSVQSETLFQRKLRQNKSLDHIQFLKEKENLLNKNRKMFTGSMIFEKSQPSDLVGLENQLQSQILATQKPKQPNQPKQLKSYGSKHQIFGSIKDRYFDIPLSIKSTNLKKNFPLNPPRFLQKGSVRFEVKPAQKRQENTRSTQAKESEVLANPKVPQQVCADVQVRYADEMTHIFLNQVHFCRFLYYLHKNALYILLCKKSQQRLGVIIFELIFQNLDELSQIHNPSDDKKVSFPYVSQKKLDSYMKSQKYQMMKKTIHQYKQKYQKEYSSLKIKLGQKVIQQLQTQQRLYQQLISKSSHAIINPQHNLLCYTQIHLKQFLKQYEHNLLLTIDSMNSMSYLSSPRYHRPKGFITANIEGLKNLYQFYRLVGILIQSGRDLDLFEKKAKIKVNTDYAKNEQVTTLEMEKIRELIRLI